MKSKDPHVETTSSNSYPIYLDNFLDNAEVRTSEIFLSKNRCYDAIKYRIHSFKNYFGTLSFETSHTWIISTIISRPRNPYCFRALWTVSVELSMTLVLPNSLAIGASKLNHTIWL